MNLLLNNSYDNHVFFRNLLTTIIHIQNPIEMKVFARENINFLLRLVKVVHHPHWLNVITNENSSEMYFFMLFPFCFISYLILWPQRPFCLVTYYDGTYLYVQYSCTISRYIGLVLVEICNIRNVQKIFQSVPVFIFAK